MARIINSDRLAIRAEAERFLATHGFSTPPLPPDQALSAQSLVVAQLTLDDLLAKVSLPAKDNQSIQAMLDTQERAVAFKRGLHSQKRNWGSLHEVAHDYLPWQRELLYCCPLLWLPENVQKQFEAEADIFTAEAFFFGQSFRDNAFAGDISLSTAIELATQVYGTSLHSTFAHNVEESPVPRCLLVWRPKAKNGQQCCNELALKYYVKSKGFRGHVGPGQIADPDGVLTKLFMNSNLGVTRHEVALIDRSGQHFSVQAESFSNSYTVFTLTPIHRRSRREDVETGKRKCSFESGIMVFTPKTDPEQGAPNRCYHLSVPTASP